MSISPQPAERSVPPGPPPQPASPAPTATWPAPPEASGRGWIVAPLIASLPAVLVAFVAIVAPAFYAPLASVGTPVLGLPLTIPFVLLFVAAIGVVAVLALRVRNPWTARAVAIVWLMPGLFLAILMPAIVLIAVNLG